MNNVKQQFKGKVIRTQSIFMVIILITFLGCLTTVFAQSGEQQQPMTREKADVTAFALIAAAVAFGFGAIGAGIAIANIGSAAMGAIGERPEIAGQALLFVALADGIAIFGFITALMILGKA